MLDNAFKHTDEGSVELRIDSENTDENHDQVDLIFEVEDTGQGISDDQLGEIFEIFEQGNSKSLGENDGFGLGLYICKELIEAMNGSLDVTSELGEGTVF